MEQFPGNGSGKNAVQQQMQQENMSSISKSIVNKKTATQSQSRFVGWGAVGILLVWGIILNYFPTFADIHSGWVWLFYIPGYIFPIIGVIGTLVELGKLPKNEFLRSLGIAGGFISGAVAVYFLAGAVHAHDTLLLILKVLMLILAMIGVLGLFMSLQYLDNSEEKRRVLSETFTLKNVIPLVLGILGFVTVLIQFIQVVLSLIHH
jgi:hypothetical protein